MRNLPRTNHTAHPAMPLPITTTSASSWSVPAEVASRLVLARLLLLPFVSVGSNCCCCCLLTTVRANEPPIGRGAGTTNASTAAHHDGALNVARNNLPTRRMLFLTSVEWNGQDVSDCCQRYLRITPLFIFSTEIKSKSHTFLGGSLDLCSFGHLCGGVSYHMCCQQKTSSLHYASICSWRRRVLHKQTT